MTTYFLVNHQDYFASGFIVNNGNPYVNTTTGLGTAATITTDDQTKAKAALYHHVLTHPTDDSERTELTDQEQINLTRQLDEKFKVISTENLESC